MYQYYIARCSHNQKSQLTRKCLVQKKVDLRTQFGSIHTLQFMNMRASEKTLPISHIKKSRLRSHTHLLPIQEKSQTSASQQRHTRATIKPIATPRSTLTNATCCWPFDRSSSSNTGSIILHGRHVTDVNMARTARWEPSRLRNDAGFVEGWIGPLPSAVPATLVEGVL